jgi:hypothetical protein
MNAQQAEETLERLALTANRVTLTAVALRAILAERGTAPGCAAGGPWGGAEAARDAVRIADAAMLALGLSE